MPAHKQIGDVGDVVVFVPSKQIFAASSASHSGPSGKRRPCVLIGSDPDNGLPMVAPFCGAVEDPKHRGTWLRRQVDDKKMEADMWHPIHYVDGTTRKTVVPIPEDGYNGKRKREEIIFIHNPKIPKPDKMGQLKPGYMWVGDSGETLTNLANVVSMNGYLKMENVDKKLPYVKGYWKVKVTPPPR